MKKRALDYPKLTKNVELVIYHVQAMYRTLMQQSE